MTDPVTLAAGAKLLEMVVSATIGLGVSSLAGGASKALKDANDQLQKEAEQRVTRMVAIVQAAAEDMTPELARIEEVTGESHTDLFTHPDFLAQVSQVLLLDGRPDLAQLETLYLRLFNDDQWQKLQAPLLGFVQKIKRRLQNDEVWGDVLQTFQIEMQIAGLNETTLRIAETSDRIARSLESLPAQIAIAAETRQRERLEAFERSYLRGLYAECNELPLAGDVPPDVRLQRRPRLQKVYVDLDVDQRPDFERILDRLGIDSTNRSKVRSALERLILPELGSRITEIDQQTSRKLEYSSVDEMFANRTEGRKALENLGIDQEDFARALHPVTALEAIRDHPQLVLLGDPGSGKSTLLRRLAGMLAAVAVDSLPGEEADWQSSLSGAFDRWLLPVRIVLSRWAAHLPASAEGHAGDLIAECGRLLAQTVGEAGADRLQELFLERLNAAQPSVLLLLDGLDEVADEEQRKLLLGAVRDFCASFGDVRLIVTCRVRPYREGDHFRLPLAEMALAPLSDDSIAAFLRRWYDELAWAGIYDQSSEQARQRLLEAISDPARSELHEMAGTPLLLTIMARVNYTKGLPGSRAMLYEDYVAQLLWEWERRRQDDRGQPTALDNLLKQAGVSPVSLERALNELAYKVHGQKGSRDTVDIPRWQMRETVEAIHPELENRPAAAADWAVQVLELIDYRSGLIRSLKKGEIYQFTHRTFQEYLAARWMAGHGYRTKFAEHIDDDNWRETVLLTLGYQIFKLGDFDSALTVIHELLPEQPQEEQDWRRVLLLGEGYVSLLTPQRAREAEGQKAARHVMETVPRLLTAAMQNRDLPARQRLEAGLLLADLDIDPPGLDDFVPVPGASFSIGRYPVTNKQFRRFMDDGGYDQDKPWWTEKAVAEIRKYWGDEWVEGPRYLTERRLNRASQPVVGVSWYEAVAYCAWLTEKLQATGEKVEVRLPTVEEWRQAAGPETYPWGKDFNPVNANTKESDLGQTTPVQMYPDGARRFGQTNEIWDLAGNVWEWTNTDGGDTKNLYYYLCGGAWYNGATGVGSAARHRLDPGYGTAYVGFRMVVVPISRH